VVGKVVKGLKCPKCGHNTVERTVSDARDRWYVERCVSSILKVPSPNIIDYNTGEPMIVKVECDYWNAGFLRG